MEILQVKGTNKKLILKDEWYSIDEDVFVKKNKNGVFELVAIYFLENYDKNSNQLFNLAKGEICLDNIKIETIENALETYGWTYDSINKTVISDEEIYNKQWSEYLIAEVLLNHGNAGDLDVIVDISFNRVTELLEDNLISISCLANHYVNEGEKWLINEYGDYSDKTTGMDIDIVSDDEYFRTEIINEINKLDKVESAKWTKEDHGYVLWIKFL